MGNIIDGKQLSLRLKGEMAEEVKALAEKPAKRWDGLVDKLIWGVAGAVLAFLLAKIGI